MCVCDHIQPAAAQRQADRHRTIHTFLFHQQISTRQLWGLQFLERRFITMFSIFFACDWKKRQSTRDPNKSYFIIKTLFSSSPLQESILKGRFSPSGQIEGFTAEIGASGSYCPQHVTLPVQVTYYDISEHSAPSPFLVSVCMCVSVLYLSKHKRTKMNLIIFSELSWAWLLFFLSINCFKTKCTTLT